MNKAHHENQVEWYVKVGQSRRGVRPGRERVTVREEPVFPVLAQRDGYAAAEVGGVIAPRLARCRRTPPTRIPMDQEHDGKSPATANDAVALATRLLRFQVELSGCRGETASRDSFVAGYLWGFCGGILAGMRTPSPGLFPLYSMVCRALFGDRDGAGLVEQIARVRETGEFVAGERVAFSDALRFVTEGRAGGGLVVHLGGSASRDLVQPGDGRPE